MEFYTYILPNGIRCVHKRVRSTVAHCALTIGAGSRDELPGEEGIAHFTEHGLFKGTAHRRAHHINCRLENLGGELNAYTTKEETVVHATTLRGDFGKAAELIADVVFRSTFPAGQIEMEKTVILDEINSYKDSPQERIWDEYEDLLFAGSPLGHNILGDRRAVRRHDSAAIAGFVRRTYNTDQMVFSSVGNLSEQAFRRVADRYFGVQAASPRDFRRTPPPSCAPFAKTAGHSTHQGHCLTGARAYDAYDERRIALSLLVNILGGPAANSLLNIALREKNGLTYNIEANYTPFSDSGIAAVCFSSDKEHVQQCIEMVDNELRKIKTTALTPRKLSMAKKQFIGQMSISQEGNEGAMLSAGKSMLMYDRVESPENAYKKVAAVTASQLMEVANEVFGQMSTLVYK